MPRLAALVLLAAAVGPTALAAASFDNQMTPDAWASSSRDARADASRLPPPEYLVIAEKVPFELPNGQVLVLYDHKVGRNRIRYEVDGIEYKPRVGATVAFPGPGYAVLVTCTEWKLPKEDFGRDSAEFLIEAVPRPAVRQYEGRRDLPIPEEPDRYAAEFSRPETDSEAGRWKSETAPYVPPDFAERRSRPLPAQPRYRSWARVETGPLPEPYFVLLPEKEPIRLPNGQWLVLKDHKVGDDQVRYEVDGIEYKPAVGETVVFPGDGFSVHLTCTRWKLLKKHYGADSAEFLIESFPER